MATFLFAYLGGNMAETPELQEAVMQAWGDWMGVLGDNLVDFGAPFSRSCSVARDGSPTPSASGLTGYSVIAANDYSHAVALAAGCPIFLNGGNVEVFECVRMTP